MRTLRAARDWLGLNVELTAEEVFNLWAAICLGSVVGCGLLIGALYVSTLPI